MSSPAGAPDAPPRWEPLSDAEAATYGLEPGRPYRRMVVPGSVYGPTWTSFGLTMVGEVTAGMPNRTTKVWHPPGEPIPRVEVFGAVAWYPALSIHRIVLHTKGSDATVTWEYDTSTGVTADMGISP